MVTELVGGPHDGAWVKTAGNKTIWVTSGEGEFREWNDLEAYRFSERYILKNGKYRYAPENQNDNSR